MHVLTVRTDYDYGGTVESHGIPLAVFRAIERLNASESYALYTIAKGHMLITSGAILTSQGPKQFPVWVKPRAKMQRIIANFYNHTSPKNKAKIKLLLDG